MQRSARPGYRLTAWITAMWLCLGAVSVQAAQLSPSVVLVLKLVAADRVQPVTGVVISGDGLVLVPADFVAEPAEIIVLDGGTDIVGHGRRAEVVQQDPELNLAVLSVTGLDRPGITLAQFPAADTRLYLEAFPPAQNIAAGDVPLRIQVTLSESGDIAGAGDAELPNVTGPVLDDCGHLAALNFAVGAQSLQAAASSALIGREDLARAADSFHLDVPHATCVQEAADGPAEAGAMPQAGPASAIPGESGPVPETAEAPPAGQIPAATVEVPETAAQAGEESPGEPAAQPPAPPVSHYIPLWLRLTGLAILSVLTWRIAVAYRGHRVAGHVQPASDEPDTLQLSARFDGPVPAPRTGLGGRVAPPALDSLPDGCTGLVVLEPTEGSGAPGSHFCPVDLEDFDIVIGRGEVDIDITHPTISRRHARLARHSGTLTVSDLGSSNGTFIDRVPCLQGEVMYVEPGSEISLGEAAFRVTFAGLEPGVS